MHFSKKKILVKWDVLKELLNFGLFFVVLNLIFRQKESNLTDYIFIKKKKIFILDYEMNRMYLCFWKCLLNCLFKDNTVWKYKNNLRKTDPVKKSLLVLLWNYLENDFFEKTF